MGRLADVIGVALTVARVAYDRDVKYPAASIAYYAFVSFVPLLLLVFAVLGEQLVDRLTTRMPRFLTVEAQRLVYDALTTASGRTGAGLFAIVVIAWGGANIAVGFLTVVERVEDAAERSLSNQLRDAVTVLGSFGFAIAAIVLTSVLFASLPAGSPVVFASPVVLLVVLTVTFLPLYYVPSRMVTSLSAAVPGALTAAFGWTVLHTAIQFYAANAAQYAIYGVLSGVIIMLTSLYLAAVVLMVGVVVNATLTDADSQCSSQFQ